MTDRVRSRPYSIIRHIAGAIHSNRDPSTLEMIVFNAYFDASGSSKNKLSSATLYVSGFVSTENQWGKFEVEWPKLLTKHGIIAPFHMTDFEDPNGPYSDWSQDERDDFLLEALALINRRTAKPISFGVVVKDLERVYKEFDVPVQEQYLPYAFCGREVMIEVAQWILNRERKGRFAETDRIGIVFEYGDDGADQLAHIALYDFKYALTFLTKDQADEFQACDLLAWEHRTRHTWRLEALKGRPVKPRGVFSRKSFAKLMESFPSDAMKFSEWKHLQRRFTDLGYKRRP
jgi:hypothetical protein